MIVAALLSSFLFIQKFSSMTLGFQRYFQLCTRFNSASLWYFFRYNNFSSNTLSCLPSLNLSKNPIKISLSVSSLTGWDKVSRGWGGGLCPQLWDKMSQQGRPVKADSIVPSPAGNEKVPYRSISLSRRWVWACSCWRRAVSTVDFTWYSFIRSSRMGLYLA